MEIGLSRKKNDQAKIVKLDGKKYRIMKTNIWTWESCNYCDWYEKCQGNCIIGRWHETFANKILKEI